jgi:hypothetical protein
MPPTASNTAASKQLVEKIAETMKQLKQFAINSGVPIYDLWEALGVELLELEIEFLVDGANLNVRSDRDDGAGVASEYDGPSRR